MVSTHPSRDELALFAVGNLASTTLEDIAQHLEECPACRSQVEQASGDTLTALLREADTALDLPTTGQTPPLELLNHPRYRLIRQLGVGGMGTVWLAEHRLMNRRVAVKVIRPEFLARPGAVERFHREVAAAARLQHPNIVAAFDAEQAGSTHFLAMEYVEGIGLDELLKQRGAIPVDEAVRIVKQVAYALAHAHDAGLVHRDVKPGNIMFTNDGRAKVLDFGLAMIVADEHADMTLTGANLVVGTPDMIAPEQAEHPHAADARSDIYSLGCTFYHLLTGQPPFPGTSVLKKLDAHRYQQPRPISDFRSDVSEHYQAIIRKMMAKTPNDRYTTAAELAIAFDQQPSMTVTTAAPPKPSRRTATWARWLSIVCGVLLIVGGFIIYRIQTDTGELMIEAQEDVEVVIKQGGKFVTLIDTKSQNKIELASGNYQLQLKDAPNLQLNVSSASLTRGKTVIARITKKDAVAMLPTMPGGRPKYYVPRVRYETTRDADGRSIIIPRTTYELVDQPPSSAMGGSDVPELDRSIPPQGDEIPRVPSPVLPSENVPMDLPPPRGVTPINPVEPVGPTTIPVPMAPPPAKSPVLPMTTPPAPPVKPSPGPMDIGTVDPPAGSPGSDTPASHWPPANLITNQKKPVSLPLEYSDATLTFSNDGKLVGVIRPRGFYLDVFETATGKLIASRFRAPKAAVGVPNAEGKINLWCFNADGSKILLGLATPEGHLQCEEWHLKTGKAAITMSAVRAPSYAYMTWSTDEQSIIFTNKNVLHVWSAPDRRITQEIKLFAERLLGVTGGKGGWNPPSSKAIEAAIAKKTLICRDGSKFVMISEDRGKQDEAKSGIVNNDGVRSVLMLYPLNGSGDVITRKCSTLVFEVFELPERGVIGTLGRATSSGDFQFELFDAKTLRPVNEPINIVQPTNRWQLARQSAIWYRIDEQGKFDFNQLSSNLQPPPQQIKHPYLEDVLLAPCGEVIAIKAENGWNLYGLPQPTGLKLTPPKLTSGGPEEIFKSHDKKTEPKLQQSMSLSTPRMIHFTPKNALIVIEGNKRLTVIDRNTLKERMELQTPSKPVWCCTSDGDIIVDAGLSAPAAIPKTREELLFEAGLIPEIQLNRKTVRTYRRYRVDAPSIELPIRDSHKGTPTQLIASKDQQVLVVVYPNIVELFNLTTGSLIRTLNLTIPDAQKTQTTIWHCMLSDDAKRLYSIPKYILDQDARVMPLTRGYLLVDDITNLDAIKHQSIRFDPPIQQVQELPSESAFITWHQDQQDPTILHSMMFKIGTEQRLPQPIDTPYTIHGNLFGFIVHNTDKNQYDVSVAKQLPVKDRKKCVLIATFAKRPKEIQLTPDGQMLAVRVDAETWQLYPVPTDIDQSETPKVPAPNPRVSQ